MKSDTEVIYSVVAINGNTNKCSMAKFYEDKTGFNTEMTQSSSAPFVAEKYKNEAHHVSLGCFRYG